jgi:hypothetical protein
LNRSEAISLIREIDEECKNIRGTSIALMEPNPHDPLAKGFQVYIKMKVTRIRLRCLTTIAEQYGYKVRVAPDNWLVTIYRPMHEEASSIPAAERGGYS